MLLKYENHFLIGPGQGCKRNSGCKYLVTDLQGVNISFLFRFEYTGSLSLLFQGDSIAIS